MLRRTLLLLALVLAPQLASARPVSPREGGFELGGAGFVGAERSEDGKRQIESGPLFHLSVRGPITEELQLGLVGRFGLGGGGLGTGATGSFVLETRWMGPGIDFAPYALLGLGVRFQAVREAGNRSVEPRAAIPVGVGLESRLTDTIMLGFALRYTVQPGQLSDTVGPVDLTICLVFL